LPLRDLIDGSAVVRSAFIYPMLLNPLHAANHFDGSCSGTGGTPMKFG
jgi:hypothetical protein